MTRRRRIEGRVEVAVDTDQNGNVTNVRLIRSSGNRELDEETLRQAREWKLKPVYGGRQGVKIATEYSRETSQRYHRLLEVMRKNQRQTEAQENRENDVSTLPSLEASCRP